MLRWETGVRSARCERAASSEAGASRSGAAAAITQGEGGVRVVMERGAGGCQSYSWCGMVGAGEAICEG